MKQTIDTASQFRDEFHKMGRANQFSYAGLEMLFDFLEEVDPDAELDVIAICCDYSEDSPESIANDYSIDIEDMDEGEILDAVTEYLEHNSTVIGKTDAGNIVFCSSF